MMALQIFVVWYFVCVLTKLYLNNGAKNWQSLPCS